VFKECSTVNLIAIILRLSVGVVIFSAGLIKVIYPMELEPLLEALSIPAKRLAMYIRIIIPVLEILLGTWLILGYRAGMALTIVVSLLVIFTATLIIAKRKGYDNNCACFGGIDGSRMGAVVFMRNAVLAGGAIFAIIQSRASGCIYIAIWDLPLGLLAITLIVLFMLVAVYALLVKIEKLF
jgi:methylamine utilization protein MauE